MRTKTWLSGVGIYGVVLLAMGGCDKSDVSGQQPPCMKAGAICDPRTFPGMSCAASSSMFVGGQITCNASCNLDTTECQLAAGTCGNGMREGAEQCDDGNQVDTDTCTNDCQATAGGMPVLAEPPRIPGEPPPPIGSAGNKCADPTVRKDYRTRATVNVRYRIHMCKDSTGSDGFSQVLVRQIMDEARAFYQKAAINLIEENYITFTEGNCSTLYEDSSNFNMNRQNETPSGVMPIVFVKKINTTRSPFPIGGYATSSQLVVSAEPRTRTVVHELGHFFGLAHTHECEHGRETAATCATSGDFLCDTPADRGPRPDDPKATFSWQTCSDRAPLVGSCNNTGCGYGFCDDGSRPFRDNVMSYYLNCGPAISDGQADFVRCELENSLSRYAYAGGMPTWRVVASGTSKSLQGIWGASANDVWAVGQDGTALHYNGASWSTVNSSAFRTLYGVWGSAANDVWAVGAGPTVVHYNGSTWGMDAAGSNPLYGIHGTASGQVFAVGDQHAVRKRSGGAWNEIAPSLPVILRSNWGVSSTDLWAVGFNAASATSYLTHYNGATWSPLSAPTMSGLYSIWGSNANDIFAVGDAGAILHYNGASWNNSVSGVSSSLFSVWGTAPSDVWAVGNNGTIQHFDGSLWKPSGSITTNHLFGVFGFSPTNVWAVGANGTIVHYSP